MRRALGVVALAVILGILGVAAGCGSRGRQATDGAGTARPRSTASVSIKEPSPGAVISGTKVRVEVEVTGGRIVLETSTRLEPDEGHIHLSLDGKLVSMTPGLVSHVDVTGGSHLLEVEYVANDHSPFSPRVIAAAPFTVR